MIEEEAQLKLLENASDAQEDDQALMKQFDEQSVIEIEMDMDDDDEEDDEG